MTEDQVTAQLEHTAGVQITSEEVRWRMEKALQYVAASHETLDVAAGQIVKALDRLSGTPERQQKETGSLPNAEAWVVEVAAERDRFTLRRLIDGKTVESYRPVSQATASVWLMAIIHGFQPPRALYRFDKQTD